MSRTLVIGSGVAAVVVLAILAFFAFRTGGEGAALALLDEAIAPYSGRYEEASYDPARDVLTIIDLTLLDIAVDEESEELDRLEIAEARLEGLAAAGLRGALNDGTAQLIFTSLDASDVTLTEEGQAIIASRVSASNLSVDTEALPSPEGLTRGQLTARTLLALSLESLVLEDFTSPEDGITGMVADHIELTGLEKGVFQNLRWDEARLWDHGAAGTVGDTVDLTVEAMEFRGVDARLPLLRALAGEDVAFDRQSDVPLFDALMVQGAVLNEEEGEPVTLADVSVENHAYVGALATDSSITIGRLRIPLDSRFAPEERAGALQDLGYDELVFGLDYRAVFDPLDLTFEMSNLSLAMEDIAEINAQLSLHDIPFTEEMAGETTEDLIEGGFVEQLLAEATLVSGGISLTDHGLMQRMIARNAFAQGVSPDDYVRLTLEQLSAQQAEMGSSPLAAQAITALAQFIAAPGAIEVTVDPSQPVPFSQLLIAAQINPVLLVELLNLQIEATPPTQDED